MHDDLDIDGFPCRVSVRCDHCVEAGRIAASFSHVTERCIQYALAHGNSALARRPNEEREAKKARFSRRSTYSGEGKISARGRYHGAGSGVRSDLPPTNHAPYAPGGPLGPPLESSNTINGNASGPFGTKSRGPFIGKSIGPFSKKPGPFSRKPEADNESAELIDSPVDPKTSVDDSESS
jgi:hypothetical protein